MILGEPAFSVQPSHQAPRDDSPFLCFDGGRVLLADTDGGAPALPTWAQVRPLPEGMTPFELAHTDRFALFCPHPFEGGRVPERAGLRYHPLHIFRSLPYAEAGLLVSCWHLWTWYGRNRFCGRCAYPLVPDASERALRCERCGLVIYPAIAPAVIVAITRGDSILLARSVRSTFRHHSLISGYVEVGETLEHAVRREVMEEVGLRLGPLRYLGDQPWGVSGSQMFAFQAEALDGDIRLQESELSEAGWFRRDELEPQGHTVSIALELIERFRTGTL